jgi:hypothetical protein
MQFSKNVLLISILSICGINHAHAALTCSLNQSTTNSGNTGSAIGTFTLDKIGTLAISNFTAWNINLTTPAASQALTNSNSAITFADPQGYTSSDPTMVSTATSLTITPTAFSISYPTLGAASSFLIKHNTITTAYYALLHRGPDDPGPGLMYPAYPDKELFYVGNGTANSLGTDSIENSGTIPASLVLSCTCVTDSNVTCPSTPTSAPIDFSFNHKQPQTYSEEIIIK